MQFTLPAPLVAQTGPVRQIERPPQGCFYDVTILVGERGRYVLKIGRNLERIAELHEECRVLALLSEQAPYVAQPVAHHIEEETGHFLFTCVEGENLLQVLERENPSDRHRLMESLGESLKRVHSWQPAGSQPPQDWLTEALHRGAKNIREGRLTSPIDHSGRFGGMDANELLLRVSNWLQGSATDLVWGHGDLCLPNLLVSGQGISGVIDWSLGGYMDRRIDLASGVWSIRYNLKEESYVESFLSGYGYQEEAESLAPYEALWILSS